MPDRTSQRLPGAPKTPTNTNPPTEPEERPAKADSGSWRPASGLGRPMNWPEAFDHFQDTWSRRGLRWSIAWFLFSLQRQGHVNEPVLVTLGMIACALGVESAIKAVQAIRGGSAPPTSR